MIFGCIFRALDKCLILVAFTLHLSTKAVAEERWVNVNSSDGSMAHARHESTFTAVGDELLLVGGRDIKPVDIYDPASGRWRSGAKPPVEVHHFQGVDWNGELWVIGAFTGDYPNESPLPYVLIYDPEADIWQRGPEIPADRRRGSAGAVAAGDRMYIAGGAQDGHRGGHVAWLDMLDPTTGEWTQLAAAPHARDHAAMVHVDRKLVFVGGRLSMAPENPFGAVVPEIDVYDIAENRWTTLQALLPNPRAGLAAVAFQGDVLVIGGETGETETAYDEVDRLNIETHQWVPAPSLLKGRHGTGATVINDRVWIAAGSGARGGGPELSSMERFPE